MQLEVEYGQECSVLDISELSKCEGDKEVLENTYLKLNAGGRNSEQDSRYWGLGGIECGTESN